MEKRDTMKFFRFLKEMKQHKNKRKAYQAMSINELKELSTDDLFEAITERMSIEEEKYDYETNVCLNMFKNAKRVFYIVNYFDMEVQNGGLCQFFVNSSREIAPYLIECLHEIHAYDYEKLLSDFINTHHISLDALDSFIIDDIDDYENQTERYPFDDFDDAYYDLYEKNPLQDLLCEYIQKHLEDFAS